MSCAAITLGGPLLFGGSYLAEHCSIEFCQTDSLQPGGLWLSGKSEPGDKESAMALIRGRKRCELRIASSDPL